MSGSAFTPQLSSMKTATVYLAALHITGMFIGPRNDPEGLATVKAQLHRSPSRTLW